MRIRAGGHAPAAPVALDQTGALLEKHVQEYLAQFVSWQGAVFRRIMDAVTDAPRGRPSVIGVDWARTGDYTVFVVISDCGHVLEIDRFRGLEYALQRGRLEALYRRHGEPLIIAEANAMGQPVIEQLARDGLKIRPFVTTNKSKAEIIEALALAFERGEVKIPNDMALIGEVQAMEATPLAGGALMRYAAASGAHDDIVVATAIAWLGIGAARKRAMAADAFRSIAWANEELATGSGWRVDGEVGEGGSDRARVLRERWRN
jgi:hypothetical protein